MESDYNMLRHTLEYENQKAQQDHQNEILKLHERINFEKEEAEHRIK